MSDDILKVKFTWKRALRPRDSDKALCPQKTTTSRSAKFVQKLKETDKPRYSEHLKRDAQRQQSRYIGIEEQTPEDQEAKRQKWAQAKKQQRLLKKEKSKADEQSVCTKPFKLLTKDEKRVL